MKHIHCKRFSVEYTGILIEEINRLIQCLSICKYIKLIAKKIKFKLGNEEILVNLCEEKITFLLSKTMYIWYKQNSIRNNIEIDIFNTLNKTMFLDRMFKSGVKSFEEISLYSKLMSIDNYNEFLKEEIHKNNKLRGRITTRNAGFLNYYNDKSLIEIHEQWSKSSSKIYLNDYESRKFLNSLKTSYVKNSNRIDSLQNNKCAIKSC